MAKKVLTEEDFKEDEKEKAEDTSSQEVPADKEIVIGEEKEEPEAKESSSKEEGREESLPKPSEEKPKFKHKSWEETEKARIELERGFTEKSMRLSEVEKRLAEHEKPKEKPIPTVDDKIAELADEAIRQINALPIEYDLEGKPTQASITKRERESAIIWAKTQRQISRLEIDETSKQVESERKIVSKTYDRATKEGLKTDAELRILGHEFSKTDSYLDVDRRIELAIENTKGILSQIREGYEERKEKDKKEKDDLRVLGRGSSRRDVTEDKDKKPSTMSQQLADLNEKRRIGKDDLRW